MQIWDAIVVGAGPAGCAAAYDLARAGRQVLLLDKCAFPRHKACAAGLTVKTLRALRYSVAPVTHRVVHEVSFRRPGGASLRFSMRKPFCALSVREEFDLFCLRMTQEAGAVFRRVGALASLSQREDGVSVEADGQMLRAGFLVGADGVHSQVRRMLGDAPWFARGFALEAKLPLPDRVPNLTFDFGTPPGGYGWIFPKRDHLNVGIGVFSQSGQETGSGQGFGRKELAAYAHTAIERNAEDAFGEPLNQVTGQYLGLGGHRYEPEGRVLLAGDAAGLVDPLTGEGIYSAVVSGQAAAAAILAALDKRGPAGEGYAERLSPLRQQLAFSARAARAFYADLDRGFRVMSIPVLRGAVMRTYALGIGSSRVLSALLAAVPHR